MLLTRPRIDLLAGWRYLLKRQYRVQVRAEWQDEPGWLVFMQILSGLFSILSPLIVIALITYVILVRSSLIS